MSGRGHMKILKSAMFVKKIFKIHILEIKNLVKLGTIVIIQLNVEIFHIGSNYDYQFIIKKILEEVVRQYTCLEENDK